MAMSRVLSRSAQRVMTKLSEGEFVERAVTLADVLQAIADLEGEQEATRKEQKAQMSALEAKRTELTGVLRRKQEPREVAVEVIADDDTGMTTAIRLDTGEVLWERQMYDSERQLELPKES